MLTEDFEKLIQSMADDGKLGGVFMAIPTGEVLEEDKSFIEVLIYEKSFFAKPCMSFGSYNVPNKKWLQKYKNEIFVAVAFENGDPAHPVYLGAVPREGVHPKGAYPNATFWKGVEFDYVVDEDAKLFKFSKINEDGSVAHSVSISDKITEVGNSDTKITINHAENTILLKNKNGQQVVLNALTILGKGGTPRSAVLGEVLIGQIGQTIAQLTSSLTTLISAQVVVNPTTYVGTFDPAVTTALGNVITSLAEIQGQLTSSLSANVKLD